MENVKALDYDQMHLIQDVLPHHNAVIGATRAGDSLWRGSTAKARGAYIAHIVYAASGLLDYETNTTLSGAAVATITWPEKLGGMAIAYLFKEGHDSFLETMELLKKKDTEAG